jgi:hypothetical protein
MVKSVLKIRVPYTPIWTKKELDNENKTCTLGRVKTAPLLQRKIAP